LLIRRGFIWASVDVGAGAPLNVMVTHLHHRPDDGSIRVAEVEALLDYGSGNGRTLLMGDFNARPETAEIELLRQSSLVEAVETAGQAPGYTFPALAANEQIDYIWLTPDLAVSDLVIPPQPASDHLGIAVTIAP
jgi:endonuclease/exonuclease/phosphatase family metal-dependent hydrolase